MRRALANVTILLAAGCGRVALEGPEPSPTEEPTAREKRPAIAVGPPVPRVIEPYRIRPLDVLEVSVLGEEDMTKKVVVGPDGRFSYFVATDVVAGDRTFAELRSAIRQVLKEYFIDPRVCVTGIDFTGNTVSILGQVRRPGTYVVGSETRLLDVIAMSGGTEAIGWSSAYAGQRQLPAEFADLDASFVLRDGKFLGVDFRALFSRDEAACARNNVLLRANDTIYIPSALSLENKIFVLGEVSRPCVVRYGKEITLLEAIAECGGFRVGARYRQALVVRGSLKNPKVIPVDLDAIRTGSTLDARLEAGDIVYVPKTALKRFNEIAGLILPGMNVLESADTIYLRH